MTNPTPDMVNHPPHYTDHPVFHGECHDLAQHMTFDAGNAWKYLWRCNEKGNLRQDLEKARWYLRHADRVWIDDRPVIADRLLDDFTGAARLNHVWWAMALIADGSLNLADLSVVKALQQEAGQ